MLFYTFTPHQRRGRLFSRSFFKQVKILLSSKAFNITNNQQGNSDRCGEIPGNSAFNISRPPLRTARPTGVKPNRDPIPTAAADPTTTPHFRKNSPIVNSEDVLFSPPPKLLKRIKSKITSVEVLLGAAGQLGVIEETPSNCLSVVVVVAAVDAVASSIVSVAGTVNEDVEDVDEEDSSLSSSSESSAIRSSIDFSILFSLLRNAWWFLNDCLIFLLFYYCIIRIPFKSSNAQNMSIFERDLQFFF